MIKRILSASFYSVLSRFFMTGTNLIIVYFITRNLGKVELGNYGILFFFFIFFSSFSSFGMHQFFGKEIAKYNEGSDEEKRVLNELLTLILLGGIITAVSPFMISLFYKKVGLNMLILAIVGGYLLGVERNLGGLLLGREKMNVESLFNLISFGLVILSLIFFGGHFLSIGRIFLLRIGVLVLVVVLRFFYFRNQFKELKWKFKLSFFKEGKYFWFGSISNVSLREIDILILSFFIDKSFLGAYFLALRIYYAFSLFAEVISTGLTPFISRAYIGKEKRSLGNLNKYVYASILVISIIFAVSLLLSRNLILSLFSPELLTNSSKYLLLLSVPLVFRFFSFYTGAILSSTEFQKVRFNISFIASLMLIVLDIVLGYVFKVEGVIVSRALVELFLFVMFGYFAVKITDNKTTNL